MQQLQQFWKWLWGIKMSRKIVCFRWLLVHRVIPINGWWKGNADNMCPFCMYLVETSKHCLWSCDFAMEIWKRIITLLIPIYPQVVYTSAGVMGGCKRASNVIWVGGCCRFSFFETWSMQKQLYPEIHNLELVKLNYGNWWVV
mgnify:CR=1 FL=1